MQDEWPDVIAGEQAKPQFLAGLKVIVWPKKSEDMH
jgi:hypothetical protein